MTVRWSATLERIAQAAQARGAKILGILSPDGDAGATTVSRALSHILAHSGVDPLLVDLTARVGVDPTGYDAPVEGALSWERSFRDGYPVMAARSSFDTRHRFSNALLLQEAWRRELRSHSILVLDLPPLFGDQDLINPLAAAASCDAVLLICMRGSIDRARLREGVALLRRARAPLWGLLLNERDYSSPAEEITEYVRKLARHSPRVAAWAERAAAQSRLLS
jgi:Mrp family chromosome partitioning ATPase